MNNKTYISFYLKNSTIRVFTSSVRKIGSPRYVRFLVNPETNKMAMTSYDKKEFSSFRVSGKVYLDSKCSSLKICSKKFCTLLSNRFGWGENKSYRIPGEVFPKEKIVIYDLTEAKETGNTEC